MHNQLKVNVHYEPPYDSWALYLRTATHKAKPIGDFVMEPYDEAVPAVMEPTLWIHDIRPWREAFEDLGPPPPSKQVIDAKQEEIDYLRDVIRKLLLDKKEYHQ